MEQEVQFTAISHPQIIQVGGGEKYKVHFKVLTMCVVTDEAGNTIGSGATQWSPSEPFNYVRGKKLALRAALVKLNKHSRALIWQGFLDASRERLERQIKVHTQMLSKASGAIPIIARALRHDVAELKRGIYGCKER